MTASRPTWKLLSGQATPRRALAVAGYRREGEPPGQFGGRLHGLAAAGIAAVKIAAGARDSETAESLAAVRARGPELDLIVDMGFAAHSVGAALESIKAWRQYGLAWVEDPFPAGDAGGMAAVRASGPGAIIGAGDEGPAERDLRHARTRCRRPGPDGRRDHGGLTGLLKLARAADRRISLHIYPEIHRHIAAALPAAEEVELFLPADPFDFTDRFIAADGIDIDPAGNVAVPSAPVSGCPSTLGAPPATSRGKAAMNATERADSRSRSPSAPGPGLSPPVA